MKLGGLPKGSQVNVIVISEKMHTSFGGHGLFVSQGLLVAAPDVTSRTRQLRKLIRQISI